MKRFDFPRSLATCILIAIVTVVGVAAQRGPQLPPPPQPSHPTGKLIVTGDVAVFIDASNPDTAY